MKALETVPASDVAVAVAAPSIAGESPFWHPVEHVLYWCDIAGCKLNRFDPATQHLVHWAFETEVASCAPMQDGAVLLAMRDGLWRFDPIGGERTRLAKPPYDPATQRFNDGKCDPQGRFWVGTIDDARMPRAALYCLEDDVVERRVDDATNSNGLAWSPNGRTMYWSDTTAHTVYAFDFDPITSRLSGRRVFAQFAQKQLDADLTSYGGRPDGATMDSAGCYWAALFEGQRLLRFSPEGEVLLQVDLPVRCPTMPCFGGDDLRTLYITTSREKRPAAELAQQPFAGCVLSLRVDVPGLPTWTFTR